MTRVERATIQFWSVSACYHDSENKSMTVHEALQILRECEEIIGPQRQLAKLIHELKFDIIEGNTKWRQPSNIAQSNGSRACNLIPIMKD